VIVARVVNHSGRAFNVRVVRRGERYGLDDKLVHDKPDPLVEFWDATYESDPRFTVGRGQFVSRYCLETLKASPQSGIDLCGHVPEWKITAGNRIDALTAIDRALAPVTYCGHRGTKVDCDLPTGHTGRHEGPRGERW
jgi:hypothetical protein